MFAKRKRAPLPKGSGAAAAKQMGLFMDLDPEEMMTGMDENLDDPDLEAELAALTGNKTPAAGRTRNKGRSPLPMEDIAKMADECMRDVDEDEDDDDVLEDDEELLAELQEVVGEEETEEAESESSTSSPSAASPEIAKPASSPTQEAKAAPAAPGSLQHTLEDRIALYKTALQNAKAAGETSKTRRFDRGLKTLETMLAAVRKGRPVNEAEIPPPVATGAQSAPSRPPVPPRPAPPKPSPPDPATTRQQDDSDAAADEAETEASPPAVPEIITPSGEGERASLSALPTPTPSSPEEQPEEPAEPLRAGHTDADEATLTLLLERQKEYRLAALTAKKQGDMEQARTFFKTSKNFDPVIEALKRGQAVDLSGLPPSPGHAKGSEASPEQRPSVDQPAAPAAGEQTASPAAKPLAVPKDALEALEQRRAKYLEASAQAKASGDERKARMHDRIAKQYQSAIRAHKAGKNVDFAELPVPPGFPPIPGQKATATAEQGLVAALEAADKIATTEAADEEEEDEENGEEPKPVPEEPKKPMLEVPAGGQGRRRTPSASPDRTGAREGLSPTALQQLEFLQSRKKQYMSAALQAKKRKDLEQAKVFLRTAKGLEPMIEAASGGKAVDISTVPSPPADEEEDFILVHHSDVQVSEKAEQVYAQLAAILKEQYEKCTTYSKQFTHLGNVAETTKFEKMAEACKKSLEVLKLSQARGLPPPRHHFEEKSFHTVRIFPELSSTEMVVVVVRGMNLPAPSGIQTADLDAYVKFDFPYPSTEQPQRHKTAVVKNTNSPEYNQSFTLSVNRNHRGFRRLVASKGLKLELLHKGGFLRSDKPIGTAHVKLDKLETQSEIREIVEVMDGRKPSGGRVEVRVRLREPLSGQDTQTSTERWLVVDRSQILA